MAVIAVPGVTVPGVRSQIYGLRLADALIGATTIEHKATLITANLKHFSAVEGLTIETFAP